MTFQPQQIAPQNETLPRRPHPLRAWRKRQFIDGKDGRRPMRLQDIEDLHGIKISTWAGWEKWPGEAGFRRPDEANMGLIFKITKGEVGPDAYYPVRKWEAELEAANDGE